MFCEPGLVQSQTYRDFWAYLGEGKFQSARYRRIGKHGAEVWIQATYNPILDVDGRHVIFVHTAPELFERREVAVGRRDGVRVEVRGDVQAGDRVVTSGLLTLKSAPAAPLPAPATAAATSATSAAPTAAAAK